MWEYIEFLQESIRYLEDSTLNITPYETIFCLEKVLEEWVDDLPVIVTSMKSNNYNFRGTLSNLGPLIEMIKEDCEVTFDEELVQIGIPQLEVYNYLYNIVIYHEVGHYIDQYYNITGEVAAQVYHVEEDHSKSELKTEHHYMEHFCDIFAAQYVGPLISDYLKYKASDAVDSDTHPSTTSRIQVVDDFLAGRANEIVRRLTEATEREDPNLSLRIRYKIPKSDNFCEYVPLEVSCTEELHGVYQTAWDVWKHRNQYYPKLADDQAFEVVNNLTGKSIANFMIRQKWEHEYTD
jgi:hypothetical protein